MIDFKRINSRASYFDSQCSKQHYLIAACDKLGSLLCIFSVKIFISFYMGKVTNWINEFAAWLEVKNGGDVEYRCKLCAERGTTLVWKEWCVCIGITKKERFKEHSTYKHTSP